MHKPFNILIMLLASILLINRILLAEEILLSIENNTNISESEVEGDDIIEYLVDDVDVNLIAEAY